MRAIAEFAIFGELKNVVENGEGAGGGVPEGDFAHAGSVDEDPGGCVPGRFGAGPRRQKNHLAGSGGVAAAVVGFANGLSGEGRRAGEGTGERVDQSGFPHAGGADERGSAAAAKIFADHVEAYLFGGADEVDVDAEGDLLDFVEAGCGVVAEVGFIQQDDRLRAALPDDGEVAFDAARIQFEIERGDHEDGVDIGRDDLLLQGAACDFAGELGFPGKDGVDPGAIFAGAGGDGHPVANGGNVGARGRGVAEFAGDVGEVFAMGGADTVEIF